MMEIRKKSKARSLEKRRAFAGYFFIFPLILGVFLVFLPNMFQTFRFTLNDIKTVNGSYHLTYVGFSHFVNAMTVDPQFIRLLSGSIRQFITDVPVLLIFSLFMATILNQKFRGRLLARAIFFVPVILATGIITRVESVTNIMSIVEVGRESGGGAVLGASGFVAFEQMLYSLNFNSGLISIVVGAANGIYRVVQSCGIQIFIFMAGLQEVSTSLYEAANVEGCSKWELFWKITFPMISPQLIVCAIYTIVDTFSKPNSALFEYVNQIAFSQNQYGLATSMYVIYFFCVAAILAVAGLIMSRFVFYND